MTTGGRAYSLRLTLTPERINAMACGELDVAACPDLRDLFARVAEVTSPMWCDLSGVTFLDTTALTVFVEATRDRANVGPLHLHPRSMAARRIIGLHRIGDTEAGHVLDVRAWDAPPTDELEVPTPEQQQQQRHARA